MKFNSKIICPKCGGKKDYRSEVCSECRYLIDTTKIPVAIKAIRNSAQSKQSHREILIECPKCRKERWTSLHHLKEQTSTALCKQCARELQHGENHPAWKGYRMSGNGLYRMVLIYPDSSYYPMASAVTTIYGGGRYVMEHRFIMAQHIGRPLLKQEHVHHINGDRLDNHVENLQLISPRNHAIYTHMCANCELRKEIRLLKWLVKQLQIQLQYKLQKELE
jgi:hypothetical protein